MQPTNRHAEAEVSRKFSQIQSLAIFSQLKTTKHNRKRHERNYADNQQAGGSSSGDEMIIGHVTHTMPHATRFSSVSTRPKHEVNVKGSKNLCRIKHNNNMYHRLLKTRQMLKRGESVTITTCGVGRGGGGSRRAVEHSCCHLVPTDRRDYATSVCVRRVMCRRDAGGVPRDAGGVPRTAASYESDRLRATEPPGCATGIGNE